jgi:hypothetical protein
LGNRAGVGALVGVVAVVAVAVVAVVAVVVAAVVAVVAVVVVVDAVDGSAISTSLPIDSSVSPMCTGGDVQCAWKTPSNDSLQS